MNLIVFESSEIRNNLLPFTFTRPVSEIRVGILTISKKWQLALDAAPSFISEDYLRSKYTIHIAVENILVNGALSPDEALIAAIQQLKPGEGLFSGDLLLAGKCNAGIAEEIYKAPAQINSFFKMVSYQHEPTIIRNLWDIFALNRQEIIKDFKVITRGRKSAGINDRHTRVYGEEHVFVEEGASIKAAILNAEEGPIYLGKNSEVMEGAIIRGAFAMLEGSIVAMGSKVRGDTTVGPFSKIGGEVSNSVIFGYSNKGHEGYLGNSVLGEWCNLGADTNTSNLKNNYSNVKLWSHSKMELTDTGRQFCGLMMGDYSRCGINTMFNTGTVVGVGANIFGGGFMPKFIPSFSWANEVELSSYRLDKFEETVERILGRRNKILNNVEKSILTHIFNHTSKFRNWENKL